MSIARVSGSVSQIADAAATLQLMRLERVRAHGSVSQIANAAVTQQLMRMARVRKSKHGLGRKCP